MYFGDERHGSEWNPQIQWWSHNVFNGILKEGIEATGFNLGDGTNDIHAQFGFTEGAFYHEDITHETEEVASTDGLKILWFSGAELLPRIDEEESFSVKSAVAGRLYYNNHGTGAKTEAGGGQFVLYHYFATNCFYNPLISVMGSAAYDEKNEAILAAKEELEAILEIIPHQTRLPLYTLIYETSNDFTNAVKARIVAASNNHIAIGWQDGSYDEIIAEVIAEETVPYLKTGWHPGVQNENAWSFNRDTLQLTIAPDGEAVRFWILGDKYEAVGSIQEDIDATAGMHYLRLEGDNMSYEWVQATDQWDNSANHYVFVTAVYYNPTQARALYVGYEAHSYNMEPETRGRIHAEVFTEYVEGLAVTQNGTDDWKINIENGKIRDEDIEAFIQHATSGNTEFAAPIRALVTHKCWLQFDEASGQLLWHEYFGTSGSIVKLDDENQVQYLLIPSGEGSGSADESGSGESGYYELASTETDEFTAIWVLATMDFDTPVKIIVGTGKGADIDEAKTNNPVTDLKALIDAAPFFCEEYILLSRIIVKNTDDAPYYNIEEIEDFRGTDLSELDKDIYVESAEFDNETQEIILHRTRNMPDIRLPLELFAEMSITGDGSSLFPFTLYNDVESPGNYKFYCTNAQGEKGWFSLFAQGGSGSGSGGSGAGSGEGSGAGSAGSGEPQQPEEPEQPLFDNYVTSGEWDTINEVLVLHRNNNLPDIEITIPNTQTYDKKEWQSFEYRNIEADTAYTFTVDIMADRAYTINSAVFQADDTISGVAVKIDGSAVSGLSSVSATTSASRTNASGNNSVAVGNKVTITIPESHGDGTELIGKISITYS